MSDMIKYVHVSNQLSNSNPTWWHLDHKEECTFTGYLSYGIPYSIYALLESASKMGQLADALVVEISAKQTQTDTTDRDTVQCASNCGAPINPKGPGEIRRAYRHWRYHV